jgi:hypothetical protein
LTRIEARYTTKWPGYILPVAAQTVEEMSIVWESHHFELIEQTKNIGFFFLGAAN